MENLGVKKLEVGLAEKDLFCEECGKTICSGRPYVQKANIAVENNHFRVVYRIECLQVCSEQAHQRNNPHCSSSRKSEIIYDACWETLPQEAGPNEKSGLVILTRKGVKVATGYSFIVEWESEGKLNRFVEVSAEQAVTSNFSRSQGGDDPYGRFKSWKTPDSVYFREYLQHHIDMRPGFFYFPAACLRVDQQKVQAIHPR